jgi:hypothetical protein
MDYFLLIAGLLLVILAILDALWTTLWVDGGAGLLSAPLSSALWAGCKAVTGSDKHKALSLAGPFILITIILTWILMLLGGWSMVLASWPYSLEHAETGETPSAIGYIYFVASGMFTMGNGEYVTYAGGWQLVAGMVSGSGMFIVTLSVTFILSVITGVANKRSFTNQVTGMGDTSIQFLLSHWDGKQFRSLDLLLTGLASELSRLNEQHMSYPLLHYYHSAKAKKATALAITVLDEATTILQHGLHDDYKPAPSVLKSTNSTISGFLETLETAYIKPSDKAPPPPDLSPLQEAGIPLSSREEFLNHLQEQQERRKILLGMVKNDQWDWPNSGSPT